ncbi:4-hydroxythreonine-4-phosphate dehydrogenase PdxA [Erythrobacter sp. F6033]|uniref:4-hydroxythreonine-4-phosphate dehydrogenase PdxA n=1 Tax=Erythrobacter sp. F6033 TaxID=2926401 RepID=UPI001FF0E037|nr:4-hydroxythreonine-4-phosphate dehydrogenase PdxA [Erythrobacter sp. F6033]MCK0127842.1 4-hydroxythreonine-4-phosphate dehydrogenase PdxA [Erythrobacter sp. F6033]
MSTTPFPLAVSLGDPAGVGPEIITASYARMRSDWRSQTFFVVGGVEVLKNAAEACGADCPVVPIAQPDEAPMAFHAGLPVLAGLDVPYTPGKPTRLGAQLALTSLEWATRFAVRAEASGMVTAPIAKAGLMEVGFEFPGQTEFLASACGLSPEDAVMMLAGPSLRAVPLTVHIALADVPLKLSSDLIANKTRIVAKALQWDFGVGNPRLAIAGLNPHSGENGQFGDEETRIIQPAIDVLRGEGFNVTGPVPGDALFTPRMRETYDAALCMYHDQALIPLKALEFDEGVNVTLGLPIIRTSPDHGTAFDIAGQGTADPSAMCAAIRMAGTCAKARAAASAHA